MSDTAAFDLLTVGETMALAPILASPEPNSPPV
jgi:hypothetical protein